jgi:CPA1 family monovalent cation:H+ antiporter
MLCYGVGCVALWLLLWPWDSRRELPERDLIVTVSFAVVAFSIFAQGLTMPPLLRVLGEIR